ncbi:MAG: ATP-binding protein, partial [Acidianus sp.]|nr:ATP-binding protein [Acidianus sp.]
MRLVLTGSQFGLLYDFLGLEDPRAPLFGRAFREVKTRRLSSDEALDFLERGFSEAGVRCPGDLMEKAVDALDGIIGWLTYFGHLYVTGGLRGLEDVVRAASSLALEELRD